MTDIAQYLDPLLFAALPYAALTVFFVMTIHRYRSETFTYSSLSSQFLENRKHFWAMVPFHYGIIVILLGHLVGLLVPRTVLAWNGHPLRLYVLEIAALALGILTLVGVVGLVARRLGTANVRVVTSPLDWLLYALLMVQVASGVGVAVFYPWGTSWYAASAAPYLWSVLLLNPQTNYVTGMPFLVQLHVVNAFLVIGLFPFTRLVHVLVVPNPYLWRKPQVVRWYRARRQLR